MNRIVVLVVSVLSISMSSVIAVAHDGTPVAGGCPTEHRTPAAIVETAGSGDSLTPIPDAIVYVPVSGTPADESTIRRVSEAAELIVACANAGDYLGFLSMLSDDFLRRFAAELSIHDVVELQRAPEPMGEDEWLTLREVRDVTDLADGRVSALVVLDQGEMESPELVSVITFVVGEDRLLIDDWQPVILEPTMGSWEIVEGSGYVGAIVPVSEVESYIRGLTGELVQGAWYPTPEQVAELELKLIDALDADPNAVPDLSVRVGEYRRHYAGYVWDGKAYLMVNAFCTPGSDDWAAEPVFVMDGGDCFFHAIYDPTTGTFVSLSINGEA